MKKLIMLFLITISTALPNSYADGFSDISYRRQMKCMPAQQLAWEDYQYDEISYGECKVEYAIHEAASEMDIKTVFLFVGGGGWFTPGEFDLQGDWMPYDMGFLCKGRTSALFAQLSYQGVHSGYGLQSQLDDSIGAMKKFLEVFPNAEIYTYGFSAGFNVFFNTYMDLSAEFAAKFKGIVFGSPAPDPSSAAFNWCVDLLADLPLFATMEDKLAEARRFSCVERLREKEICQKSRLVLLRGTMDELVTAFDFQSFKEILDAKSFVKTILYYGVGHSLPWNPVIEQLTAIESLNHRIKQ